MPYHFKIQEFSARAFFNLSRSPQSQSHFTSFENNLVYCSLNFINCVNCICSLKWWEKKMKRERKRVQSKLYAPFNGYNRSGDIYIRMLKKMVSMLVLVCLWIRVSFNFRGLSDIACKFVSWRLKTVEHFTTFRVSLVGCPIGVRVSLRFWRDLSIIAFSDVGFEKKEKENEIG